MKISPTGEKYTNTNHIRNNYSKNNIPNNDSNVTDLNFLNKNYNQVSFNGISPKESLDMVLKIPLEDRLASLFEKTETGDLILIGKKLSEAKIRMLENVNNASGLIKRVFFLPEEKYRGYLGFYINDEWEKEVINLNDYEIKLIDADSLKTDYLTSNDSYYVYENDLVSLPGLKDALQIKSKPKVDLTGFRKNFCKAVDFTKIEKAEIEKINRKIISQLTRETKETNSKVTFKDVGGQDELIKELKRSILYPIKYPEMYESFDINKGFVLYGPPGTGKTHIARALANEAEANFVSLNGLEMESKWVGESEENWRNLFEEAKQKQPSIIFIDEIDAIGKSRGGNDVHGDKTLNQVLTLISDLDQSKDNLFIIGATNNFKSLDKALIRAGRLSKHIEVKLPDLDGVKQIFDIHSAKKPLDKKIDKEALTKKLYDLKASGSDIRYIINEAHIIGFDRAGIHEKMEEGSITGKDKMMFRITQEDFDNAIQKFVETRNGTERKTIGFNSNSPHGGKMMV